MSTVFASSRVSLVCFLVVSALPAVASAGDAERPTPPMVKDWRARRELALSARQAVFLDGHAGGLSLGADVLHRRGLFVVGAVGEYGSAVLSPYTYWGGGGAVGLSAPTPSWLRLDLLGVAGAHSYSGVGANASFVPAAAYGVLNDPGSSAVLPFAGARLRTSIEIGAAKRFAIGLEALAETDLTRVTRSYETTAIGIGYRDVSAERRTVGTARLAGALTLGGTFDL